MITSRETVLNPLAHRWAVLIGTARAYFVILNTYAIQRIRNPIALTINFATWRIAYGLTGHKQWEENQTTRPIRAGNHRLTAPPIGEHAANGAK